MIVVPPIQQKDAPAGDFWSLVPPRQVLLLHPQQKGRTLPNGGEREKDEFYVVWQGGEAGLVWCPPKIFMAELAVAPPLRLDLNAGPGPGLRAALQPRRPQGAGAGVALQRDAPRLQRKYGKVSCV